MTGQPMYSQWTFPIPWRDILAALVMYKDVEHWSGNVDDECFATKPSKRCYRIADAMIAGSEKSKDDD